jgi:hypothetical protein
MASRSRAKSGNFYLRESIDTNGGTFATDSVDISSFVNVLDGELLRVKRIWWYWGSDGGGPVLGADLGASKGCSAFASVSTESRTSVGSFLNNDVISENSLYVHTDSNTDIDFISNSTSVNPADYEDGYLVATDAIHLNVDQSADVFTSNVRVQVMLECEIVKLSLSDAQAVLVSQTVG